VPVIRSFHSIHNVVDGGVLVYWRCGIVTCGPSFTKSRLWKTLCTEVRPMLSESQSAAGYLQHTDTDLKLCDGSIHSTLLDLLWWEKKTLTIYISLFHFQTVSTVTYTSALDGRKSPVSASIARQYVCMGLSSTNYPGNHQHTSLIAEWLCTQQN